MQEMSRKNQHFTDSVIPALREEIQLAQESAVAETEFADNVPAELLTEEELVMTEVVIDGFAYIGYLAIPDLGLELPVMSGWDYSRLRISPCRYSGSVRGDDLVVMAHNYKAHFGTLSQLTPGALVQFLDIDGNLWNYQVEVIDVLAAQDVEEMTAGEFDLTLFTCAKNRTHRVTVRCNKIEEVQ